jgi:uncharacterized protein (TIGR02300 family)
MVKPEWGAKRTCQNCATRFYDLQKSPIVCPKCGAPYEMHLSHRGRRSRLVADDSKAVVLDELVLADGLDLPDEIDSESVVDDLIEDTEELGESLDNMVVLKADERVDH